MRELTSHKVNEANQALTVEVLDEPGPGGACHLYTVKGFVTDRNPSVPEDMRHVTGCRVIFQNGAIGEVGVNGVTHEALLAILEDRLHSFQQGPYACEENEDALGHIRAAQAALHRRTRRRVAQGVEGTLAIDPKGPEPDPAYRKPDQGGQNAIMRYFSYEHLPAGNLRETSALVAETAKVLDDWVPNSVEKSEGLRKLLEAKDCFVRAVLP